MDNNKRKKGNNGPKTKKTKGKKKQNGSSDSSLSSLGSLPDERQVTRHFSDEFSHTPTDPSSSASTGGIHRRRAVPGSSSQHAAMLSEQRRERPVQRSQKSDSDLNTAMRTCPHCRKVFVNSWAVPKHVLVSCFGKTKILKPNLFVLIMRFRK